MSASERLRALDGALPEPPLRLIGGWPALEELRAALPLIADVVEAAEDTEYATDPEWPLHRALTTLSEHLEGQ